MEPTKRIFVNTIAQYTKAVVNTCLSLYTVRLVLNILGHADYGIMSVIGGIVIFLGFITNAMVVTTQRHLSYDYGSKTAPEVRKTFANCIFLHLLLGASLLVMLLSVEEPIVSPSFLNIDDGRWGAAHAIYKTVSAILFLTFLTAPFKALLIARENIVFISCVEMLDGFLKLGIVLLLPSLSIDKLIAYALMLLAIMVFEFIVFSTYCITKYPECSLRHFSHDINRQQIKRLSGFAGWTTYGMGVIIARNQGLAWLLNYFFNTIINASYGIANQLFTAVQFIASSIINAMNPQMMKAEGLGDRSRMLRMAEQASKIIVCMMAILFIPLMVEMDGVLHLWLGNIPPHTTLFCNSLLAVFLIDQFTSGLNSANQAIGKIKTYTLIMYTPKVLLLVIAYMLLHRGFGVKSVMICFMAIEAIVALARLPYMHIMAGLNVRNYIKTVFIANFWLIAFMLLLAMGLRHISDSHYRFLATIPLTCLCGAVFAWFVTFNSKERQRFTNIIKKK
ncbi:MAG: hypothetical protein I3J02_10440 [Prevotella sp.]|nr:hypothetical protein [Prevotella sp.]